MAKSLDLIRAVYRSDLGLVSELIGSEIDINYRDSMNRTILHHLVKLPAPFFLWATMVKKFIEKGGAVDAADMFRRTPLHYVIFNDEESETKILQAKHLVELGANINAKYEPGLTSLQRAIQQQNIRGIQVLSSLGVYVNGYRVVNVSALAATVKARNVKVAKCLVELGADIDSPYSFLLPIIQAVESGRLDILKILIQNGADLNGKRVDNNTPVMTAIAVESQKMTEWLAAAGADLNAKATMSTVFHEVVRLGRVDMLECLVNAGLNLKKKTIGTQITALNSVINQNDLVLAEILLSKGADVNLSFTPMYNSFSTAVRQGDVAMVKALVRLGVDIDGVTIDPVNTIFSMAIQSASPQMLKLLIKSGGDIHSKYDRLLKPIHIAVARGDVQMIRVLTHLGADVNEGRLEGVGLLNELIRLVKDDDRAKLDKVKVLVDTGIDINMGHNESVTALHDAVRLGKTEMVQILCELGADINKGKSEGLTPLVTAINNGREDIVRYIIRKGADMNVKLLEPVTPLHDAVRLGNIKMAESLINAGASNARGKETISTLHLATRSRDHKMVRCLLECGANINNMKRTENISPQHDAVHYANTDMIVLTNCPDSELTLEGITPLWDSVCHDLYDVTETLLLAGADVTRTTFGVSPLGWAVRQGNSECIPLLHELGQKRLRLELGTAMHLACRRGFIDVVRLLIMTGSDATKPGYLGDNPLEYLPFLDTVDYHVLQEASFAERVVEEVHIETVSVANCQEMTTLLNTPGIGDVHYIPRPCSRQISAQVKALLGTPTLPSRKLQWRVKAIGSAAEGTKVGLPNEMDFLFERKSESTNEKKKTDLENGYMLVEPDFERHVFEESTWCPNVMKGSSLFHQEFVSQIRRDILRVQTLNPDRNVSTFTRLLDTDVRATNRKACSVILVQWEDGSTNFIIPVDLVPSEHVNNWPKGATTKTWLMNEDELRSRGYYLVPKPPHVDSDLAKQFTEEVCQSAWKISFPHLETEHMQRLEQRIKDVYLMAKCLRNPDVCHILILEEGKLPRPVDKYVTSYQLKMCFFQNVEHFRQTDLSLEEMVCKVYSDLEDGLSKGFIPLFFLPKVSAFAGIKLDVSKCLKVAKIMARFVRGLYLRDRRSDNCEFTTDEDQEVVVYQRKPGAVYSTYSI